MKVNITLSFGVLLWVLALTVGCTLCPEGYCDWESHGIRGNFIFEDVTPGAFVDGDRRVEAPMAVGGTIVLRVKFSERIISVRSGDPDVFKIVGVDGEEISLTGVSAGKARLIVTDNTEATDDVEIEVREVNEHQLFVEAWSNLVRPHREFFDGPMVLLPNTTLDVFAVPLDAEGNTLKGYEDLTWTAAGGVSSLTNVSRGNRATLVTGEELQSVTLSFGDAALTMDMISEDAIADLELIDMNSGRKAARGSLLETDVRTYVRYPFPDQLLSLSAFDAQGRYVLGAGSEVATVEVLETFLPPVWSPSNGSEFALGRVFGFRIGITVESDMTFHWLGKSETFRVRLVAPQ